jgi:hypothetical protein
MRKLLTAALVVAALASSAATVQARPITCCPIQAPFCLPC